MSYYYFLLSTIYHTKENDFDKQKFEIKPRAEWIKTAVTLLLWAIVSLLVFLLFSTVPYVGPFFFLVGILGFLFCMAFCIRDFLVYKDYDNIFTEENINKLIDR